MRLLDDLFEMSGGYVLDFTDRTFSEFFREELNINIDDPKYDVEGTSKAKRLRFVLKSSDPQTRLKTLLALWEYRQALRRRAGKEETVPNAKEEFFDLIGRLGGTRPKRNSPSSPPSPTTLDGEKAMDLIRELVALNPLQANQRGYAYERFLKNLFDVNGLAARASFRLRGEQIDGSFELSADTYLLEAKWTREKIGAADLRAFNGKVEDKAAWSRGLFISDSGFSEDGLFAFGRGHSVICMDGLDVWEMLEKRLSLADVLARKARRAAETGNPFVRVRDLFP